MTTQKKTTEKVDEQVKAEATMSNETAPTETAFRLDRHVDGEEAAELASATGGPGDGASNLRMALADALSSPSPEEVFSSNDK